jgi:hypothetical protein
MGTFNNTFGNSFLQGALLNQSFIDKATFSRSSIAYLDGTQYPANTKRTKTMYAASKCDLTRFSTENVTAVGAVNLTIWGKIAGYYWASTPTKTGIYRSLDLTIWDKVVTDIGSLTGIYDSGDNNLLIVKAFDYGDGLRYYVYKINPSQIASFTTVNIGSGVIITSALGGGRMVFSLNTCPDWGLSNYHKADNGTIVFGEYILTGGATSLYRSVDHGATWTIVHTQVAGPNVEKTKHNHSVCKHGVTGRWLAAFGDGIDGSCVIYSDDDAITWTTAGLPNYLPGQKPAIGAAKGEANYQPVEMFDYGHATKILTGSDSQDLLSTLDVITGNVETLYDGGERTVPYIFSIGYFGGVYFAGSFQSSNGTPATRCTAILVSSDAINWLPYHAYNDGNGGVVKFLGLENGKLQMVILSSDLTANYRDSISIPSIVLYNALCIDPPVTNLISTPAKSGFEWTGATPPARSDFTLTVALGYVAGTTYSRDVVVHYGGANLLWRSLQDGNVGNTPTTATAWWEPAIYWQTKNDGGKSGPGYLELTMPPFATPSAIGAPVLANSLLPTTEWYNGRKVTGRISAKTKTPQTFGLVAWKRGGVNVQVPIQGWHEAIPQTRWGTFKLATQAWQTGDTSLELNFKPNGATSTFNRLGLDVMIDDVMIAEAPPARWQIGGTPRTKEILTQTIKSKPSIKMVSIVAPESMSVHYNLWGRQYIYSFVKDATNFISIYFDANSSKIGIVSVTGGAAEVVSESAVVRFWDDQPIHLSVNISDLTASLLFNCGGTEATLTVAHAIPVTEILTVSTGDKSGDNVLSSSILKAILS